MSGGGFAQVPADSRVMSHPSDPSGNVRTPCTHGDATEAQEREPQGPFFCDGAATSRGSKQEERQSPLNQGCH